MIAKDRNHGIATGIGMAILITLSFLTTARGQNAEPSSKASAAKDEQEILKRVGLYPDTPIGVEKHDGEPLFIREATTKEITSGDLSPAYRYYDGWPCLCYLPEGHLAQCNG
jgi:hypothetical protein